MAFQIQLECPGCTATLSIEAEPGQLIECPGCGTKMQLNAPPPPEPVVAEPNHFEEFRQAVPEPVIDPLAAFMRTGPATAGKSAAAAKSKNGASAKKPGVKPATAGKPGAAPAAAGVIEAEPGEGEEDPEAEAAAKRKKTILLYSSIGGGAVLVAMVLALVLLPGGTPGEEDKTKTVAKTPDKTDDANKPPDAGDGSAELAVWLPPGVRALGPHRMAHSDFVTSAAFSPDGKTLVSAGLDKVVRMWDPQTGRLMRRITAHTGNVYAVAFAPNGEMFATAGADRQVKVWNAVAGGLLQNMTPAMGELPIRSLAFAPDSKTLASGGDDEQVILWDTSNGSTIRSFGGHVGPVASLTFSPDGQLLASTCRDNIVRLFQVSKGSGQYFKLEDHGARPTSVAFSPDGKTLASVDQQRNLILFDVSKPNAPRQRRQARISGGSDGHYSVAYSPDGKHLAAGGADKTIQVVNAADLTPVGGLGGHTAAILTLSFSKSGLLASAGNDRTVRVWNPTAGEKAERFASRDGHTGYVYSAAFGPGGKTILSAGDDRQIRLWNMEGESGSPEVTVIPTTHFTTIRSLAYSRDGKRAATGSYDMRVLVFDVAERKLLHTIAGPKAHSGEVLCVAFSPDGQMLASGSQDETIRLWDPNTGQEYSAPLVGHRKPVLSIAFTPDGQAMASGAEDGGVRLWDHVVSSPLRTFAGFTEPVRALAFSPDGKLLAGGCEDGVVRLWETANGAEALVLAGLRGGVRGLAFAADGRSLAASSTLGELAVYGTADGSLVRWAQYATPVESIAFSPDGRTLLTANGNTSLYLVDIARAGDPLSAMEQSDADGDAALWTATLRDDRDVKNLRTAAAGLGRMGKEAPVRAVPALISRLHHENAEVQAAVSDALVKIGPSTVPAMITAYKTAVGNTRQRVAVLTTFGQMGPNGISAAPLLSAALADKLPELRTAAATALGKLGPGAVAALLPLLSSTDAAVRGAAEGALLNDKMLPIVVKAAGRDRDAATRITAMAALAKMGDKAEARAMPVLLEALEDKNAGIRAAAVRTIGVVCSGDRDTVEMLALLLAVTEEDRAVRLAAAQAIGHFGRPAASAAACLLGLFDEPKAEDLQMIAADTLAKLGPLPTEAVSTLLKAMDDKRWQVREKIAETIGNMGVAARDYAAELQKRQSAETDEAVRRRLAEAIRKVTAETE